MKKTNSRTTLFKRSAEILARSLSFEDATDLVHHLKTTEHLAAIELGEYLARLVYGPRRRSTSATRQKDNRALSRLIFVFLSNKDHLTPSAARAVLERAIGRHLTFRTPPVTLARLEGWVETLSDRDRRMLRSYLAHHQAQPELDEYLRGLLGRTAPTKGRNS